MRKNKLVVLGMMLALSLASLSACSKPANNSKVTAESIKKYGEVKVVDLKDVEISVLSTDVTEEEVDTELNNILLSAENVKEIEDRPVEDGDVVNIDFTGKKDGVEFEGGKAQAYDLTIGSGQFVPGFEEQLIGMNKGDKKSIDITFPTNYGNKELAGQAVVFDITLNKITKKEPAVLSDEWVKEYTDGAQKTVKEYKEVLKEKIKKAKEAQSEMMATDIVLEELTQKSDFIKIEESAVNEEYEKTLANLEERLKAYGQTFDDMAQSSGLTIDEYKEEIRTQADTMIKHKLLVETIMKDNKLKVEDADYQLLADATGVDIEELKKHNPDEIDFFAKAVVVSRFVQTKAKVKKITYDEFIQEQQEKIMQQMSEQGVDVKEEHSEEVESTEENTETKENTEEKENTETKSDNK